MSAEIKIVGVVGAGVMGASVAQALAQTGQVEGSSLAVVLVDLKESILDQARQAIWQGVRFHHLYKPGSTPISPAEVVGRITFTTKLEDLAQVDFVVENITEKWAAKQPLYAALDRLCQPGCLMAANTSAIPITQIAGATTRPAQVIGIHFMNPVPLKPAAEVIRGYHTSDETLATSLALLARMGIDGIVVNDSPGFVTNRVLMLTINEAIFLVHEGVAMAEDIDKIFTQCFGHKMGPLATGDLIGLDTILLSLEVLHEQFCDPKFRPCPLLRQMVHAGLYGRKSGQGFFAY